MKYCRENSMCNLYATYTSKVKINVRSFRQREKLRPCRLTRWNVFCNAGLQQSGRSGRGQESEESWNDLQRSTYSTSELPASSFGSNINIPFRGKSIWSLTFQCWSNLEENHHEVIIMESFKLLERERLFKFKQFWIETLLFTLYVLIHLQPEGSPPQRGLE